MLEKFKFGLRAYVTFVLVTVPMAKWFLMDDQLPEWAVVGMLGAAATAGAFEYLKQNGNSQ